MHKNNNFQCKSVFLWNSDGEIGHLSILNVAKRRHFKPPILLKRVLGTEYQN